MTRIEKTIDVEVPVRTAYNQWTQFEQFPAFMDGVKEVRQLGPRDLRWKAEVAGKPVEWTATIVDQQPDRYVAWRSTSGEENGGEVFFEPAGPTKTKITLRIDYTPTGIAEKAASALQLVKSRVDGDLKRFKEFIESRGTETGAWRGEIRAGAVRKPENGAAQQP